MVPLTTMKEKNQMSNLPSLTLLEARILGVLVEKERTTPDAYPLTLNSLTAGCNQKSSRDPIMCASDTEVQAALEELRGRTLVLETYGASGRVLRYTQNFAKCYGLPAASIALLAVLMLRGAQTVSELRANCERLYHFDDASSVEAYLEELAERSSGALTVKLPKQAGSREHRWAHLVCGEAAQPADNKDNSHPGSITGAELEERVTRLEETVAELQAALSRIVSSPTSQQ
jgi:uncharacterized protein YceH (UPF0502 family)